MSGWLPWKTASTECEQKAHLSHPVSTGEVREAKAMCQRCVFAADCLKWGVDMGMTGLYGGQLLRDGSVTFHDFRDRSRRVS